MTLTLDPDIRDWVVLPLFVIMVTTGLLRYTVGLLFTNEKVKIPYITQRGQYILKQTTRTTRTSAMHYMTTKKYTIRKQHIISLLRSEAQWCEDEKIRMEKKNELNTDIGSDGNSNGGTSSSSSGAADPLSDMMNNPMKMMGGNMFFMVQNMVMMQGIQHFFSGFILLQIPFPLTVGFKNMFQKGVMDMPDLAASYVSSVSWYFLVMYGLRGFLKLLIGTPIIEQREQDMYAEQIGYQFPPPPNKTQDAEAIAKLLRTEADNIEMLQHNQYNFISDLDSVERRLLGKARYPQRKKVSLDDDEANEQALFLLGTTSSSKKKQ